MGVKQRTSIIDYSIEEFRLGITPEINPKIRNLPVITRKNQKDQNKRLEANPQNPTLETAGNRTRHLMYVTMTERKENHVLLHVIPVKLSVNKGWELYYNIWIA